MPLIKQITKRFLSGQDLKKGIEKIARENKISAGCLVSAVASLEKATLRMAGGKKTKSWRGPLEIVAGTGTVSQNGCHIHIAVADKNGKVFGGHLKEGCLVRTTAEIVLLVFPGLKYRRKLDKNTGYEELVVE